MGPIVILEGKDLRDFVMEIAGMVETDIPIRSMRFAIDGGLKVKINGGMWSPPLGEVAPRD